MTGVRHFRLAYAADDIIYHILNLNAVVNCYIIYEKTIMSKSQRTIIVPVIRNGSAVSRLRVVRAETLTLNEYK